MNQSQMIVEQFFAAWNDGHDAMIDAFRRYFQPDAIWRNSGFPDTQGVDAALTLMDQFCGTLNVDRIGVILKAVVADGAFVVTERQDDLIDAEGNIVSSMDVLGIFEIADGKIREWREYADPREVLEIARQRSTGPAQG